MPRPILDPRSLVVVTLSLCTMATAMTGGYGYNNTGAPFGAPPSPNPNPYQPPSYATQGQWAAMPGPSSVSPAIVESLRKTRPWVLLLAILGAIWTGFALLGGLGLAITAATVGGEGQGVIAVGYLVMAGVYVLPLIMMFRYTGAIQRLLHGGGQQELEQAVDAQRSVWQVFGIMALLGIVFMILFIFGMIAFAASLGPNTFKF